MNLLRVTLLRADDARNLAVFRIVVALTLLGYGDLYAAPRWAALPPDVRVTPAGLGPLLAALPITPMLAQIALAVMVGALVSALAGWWTRASFAVASVAGFYVLGIPELAGTPLHHHHLLWFTTLLAASPCGDALSVDAWRSGLQPARSVRYGFPLRVGWLLLGCIYFFPGFWKLRSSGLEWALSDNLRNQMYAKWFETGVTPALRIDHLPWLCEMLAAGVILFELSFVVLVFIDRLRPWAVAGALLFHAGAAYWMDIHFSALWFCYAAFVDWSRLFRFESGQPAPRQRPAWSTMVATVVLFAGVATTGVAGQMASWPFACYPTFQWIAADRLPALDLEVVAQDGKVTPIPRAILMQADGVNHYWGLSWRLLREPATNEQAFRDYWTFLSRRPEIASLAGNARAIRFWQSLRSTVPEMRDAPALERLLLHEVTLPVMTSAVR